MKTAICRIQLSHMECGSRAAAFLVSDLFFRPLQREACRFDPIPRTFNHTRRFRVRSKSGAFEREAPFEIRFRKVGRAYPRAVGTTATANQGGIVAHKRRTPKVSKTRTHLVRKERFSSIGHPRDDGSRVRSPHLPDASPERFSRHRCSLFNLRFSNPPTVHSPNT